MSSVALSSSKHLVVYPETDGEPIAENTLQLQWIMTILGGLTDLFRDDPNVFVAADLFWYPVEGNPGIRLAPDAMVAFGRPKGHRGSYRQWEDGGIAPQVVFEVLSPGNRAAEMIRKFEFYRKYGVEEYYIYDPDPPAPELTGYIRRGVDLGEIDSMNGFVSPRLGIRFDLTGEELQIIRPDGRPFRTFEEVMRSEELERKRADEAVREVEELRARLRALGQNVD